MLTTDSLFQSFKGSSRSQERAAIEAFAQAHPEKITRLPTAEESTLQALAAASRSAGEMSLRERVVAMHRRGTSARIIAAALGHCSGTISKILREEGVQITESREMKKRVRLAKEFKA